jgi:hypothetical protein
VPRVGSIVDAPPRSIDGQTAIDRQCDVCSSLVADGLPITLYPTVS